MKRLRSRRSISGIAIACTTLALIILFLGFNAATVFAVEGVTDRIDYLIITNDELNNSGEFQPLIDDKVDRGLTVSVETVENIAATVSGRDIQEKIKNYIQDKHANNGLTWVLLGGDTNIVPVYRFPDGISFTNYEKSVPADTYYVYRPGEDIDIFIGRAPVNNAAQVTTFVTKVLNYQRNIHTYFNNVLFWNMNDYTHANVTNIPTTFSNLMPNNFTKNILTQVAGQGKSDVMDALNSTVHYNIFNHVDHGDWASVGIAASLTYGMTDDRVWDYLIHLDDFKSFNWGIEHPSIMIGGGCWTAAFDQGPISEGELGLKEYFPPNSNTVKFEPDECVGEWWIINPNGGGVAMISGSRSGNVSEYGVYYLPQVFYTQLFQGNNIKKLGQLMAAAKNTYRKYAEANWPAAPQYLYSLYEWTLLGDPEMEVMTADQAHTIQGRIEMPGFTRTANVTLSLSATEDGVALGTGAKMRFSTNGTIWETPVSYAATKSRVLSSGDGNKTLYVQFIDPYNNYSSFYSANTFLDTSPQNLTATTTSASQIRLTWQDNSTNETGFKIERRTESGSYAVIATVASNVTAYTNISLPNNTKYYYRIRAVYTGTGVYSLYSNEASAATYPATPTSLVAKALPPPDPSNWLVNLTWTNTNGPEVAICVEFKGVGGTYWEVAETGGTQSSVAGLSPKTTYYFRVRAHNQFTGMYSPYSNEASAVTLDAYPAAPSNLAAAAISASQIKLTWKDNAANETGFKIERRIASGSYTAIASLGANITTYTNSGLTAKTLCYYRVKATNNGGSTSSDYSNEASARTL